MRSPTAYDFKLVFERIKQSRMKALNQHPHALNNLISVGSINGTQVNCSGDGLLRESVQGLCYDLNQLLLLL
ncbi:hypothetical protein BHE74_00015929 [Ensete ventricosum]|nr:hypothetical protein BHE74_00015929 [Ensete ventricosum]